VTVTPARARRPRRRRSPLWTIAAVAAVATAFVVGIALGEALNDNPAPGGTQTSVRTLRPLPLAPAARETVTVTRSQP
jgi:hypothetical protein